MTKHEEAEITKTERHDEQQERRDDVILSFSIEEFRAAKQNVLRENHQLFERLKDA